MNRSELQAYRRRLVALAARIGGEVSDLRGEAMQFAGTGAGAEPVETPVLPEEQASHEAEEELTLTLLGNEEELLAEVGAALDRIGRGTFGRCPDCGKGISRDRLRAMPYARYCVACAGRHEAPLPGASRG
jgi:RNA polymerase-binding transcription factor DksA